MVYNYRITWIWRYFCYHAGKSFDVTSCGTQLMYKLVIKYKDYSSNWFPSYNYAPCTFTCIGSTPSRFHGRRISYFRWSCSESFCEWSFCFVDLIQDYCDTNGLLMVKCWWLKLIDYGIRRRLNIMEYTQVSLILSVPIVKHQFIMHRHRIDLIFTDTT